MWCQVEPPFVPHPLFKGPHRQTIAAVYLGKRHPYRAVAHRVPLPDGDRLALHEDQPKNARNASGRNVLLVHGLAGCHGSGYVQRLADKLASRGHRPWRLDMRGCGAGMELARGSVHAGRTSDLACAAKFIGQQRPDEPLTLVGFSLGASIALKMLGTNEALEDTPIDSAIAVAPPLDLSACSQNLSRGLNRFYDRHFVRTLKRYVRYRQQRVPDLHGVDWSDNPRTLFGFDASFTAPLGGFKDVGHYYEASSSLPHLSAIQLPTRILFAEDDPLIVTDRFRAATFSPSTQVFATSAGGHLGFLASRAVTGDSDWHWMDWRLLEWVDQFDKEQR